MIEGTTRLAGGGRIAWQIHGDGVPTVLLLRPLGGSMALWGRFRDELAARARVISFDARGTGASSGPARRSTRAMARDAGAVLDDLGVASACVFGESIGGMAATWLAIEAPARVQRLALASTLPRGRATGALASVQGLRRGLALARCFARGEHAAARCLTHRILSAGFRDTEPTEAARIEEAIAAEGIRRGDTLVLLGAAALHDATSRLRSIAAPTLVLCGGQDPLLTVDSQRALLRAIPDVTFDVIPKSGHAITFEQPLTAATRVDEFFFGPG